MFVACEQVLCVNFHCHGFITQKEPSERGKNNNKNQNEMKKNLKAKKVKRYLC